MPVTAEIGASINFKSLLTVRTKCDSLSPRGLQILYKVDYCISVGCSRILREAGALMRRVGNIRSGALLQESSAFPRMLSS